MPSQGFMRASPPSMEFGDGARIPANGDAFAFWNSGSVPEFRSVRFSLGRPIIISQIDGVDSFHPPCKYRSRPLSETPDLNLLPVFEALLRHGNVTRAAADMGLTQSAM